jgi:hypothetical protein
MTTTIRTQLDGYVWASNPAGAAYDLSQGYSYESVARAHEDNLERRTPGRDQLYHVTAEVVDTEPTS